MLVCFLTAEQDTTDLVHVTYVQYTDNTTLFNLPTSHDFFSHPERSNPATSCGPYDPCLSCRDIGLRNWKTQYLLTPLSMRIVSDSTSESSSSSSDDDNDDDDIA